nr:protein eyes shut homolog [Equus asinus]
MTIFTENMQFLQASDITFGDTPEKGISYTIPVGSPGVACMIEMTADGKPPIQKKDTETPHASQAYFESMFLGHVPTNVKIHKKAGPIYGFRGCIRELQVNDKEFFIIDEALRGKNIENCHVPWCAHHLCHNNGTCIRSIQNERDLNRDLNWNVKRKYINKQMLPDPKWEIGR